MPEQRYDWLTRACLRMEMEKGQREKKSLMRKQEARVRKCDKEREKESVKATFFFLWL